MSYAEKIEALVAERDRLHSSIECEKRMRKDAEEDAERYRWLRSRLPGAAYRVAGVIYSEGGPGVDAGIDAAMASERSVGAASHALKLHNRRSPQHGKCGGLLISNIRKGMK